MANIVPQYDLSNIKSAEDFMRYCSIVVGQIVSAINGQLDFSNLKTQTVTVQFPAIANTNTTVSHTLGKTGVKYIAASLSAATDVYAGSGSDSTSVLNLRSSVGGVSVTLILY